MLKKQIRSIVTLILIITLVIPFFATPVSAAYENTYKNTGNMRNDIIGVALTQVGYREGSNNYTKYGVWYGLSNSPWCGMFVSWCAKEAGIPTSILKRTGIANPSNFGLSYKDGKNYTPKKGDLFFKKGFSHVGLVYYTEGAYFYTIEGNTSTDSYDGHSVMIRKRKISDFYFSSPNYSGSSSTKSGCDHNYKTKVESAHPHKEYKICSKCDKKSYTGKEIAKDTCKTCIQNACDHSFNQWKKVSDSKHSRICSKCDLEQTKSHDWEKGKVLKAPTCVDEGSQQIICSDCGTETTKTIDATGEHTYGDFSFIDESEHQKVCSVCNKQTTSKHTLSKNWQHDSIYHWTSCADCGGRIRHEEHSFPNGCLEACESCGYVMEDGHKTTGEKLYNDAQHWEICSRCSQKAEVHDHVYTSDCDEICNSCGYRRSGTADHQDVYHADKTGHWRRCTSCTRVTGVVSHTADRNAQDWENQHCIHCNFELRSADAHIHTFDTVEFDETTHWGICACGETMDPEVHSWDFQTGSCSICGAMNVPTERESTNILVTMWHKLWKNK